MEITRDRPLRRDWDALTVDAAFVQGWAYGAVAERLGATVHRLRIGNASCLGVTQVIERGIGPLRLLWLPGGIHWLRGADTPRALKTIRSAWPGAVFVLSPDAGRVLRQAPQRAVLDLSGDLRAGLRKKWRNRLTCAGRAGLSVTREPGCPDWLLGRDAEMRRRRGYRALPHRWLATLHRVSPGTVESWIASDHDGPVAGVCLLRHGREAVYHLGQTTRVGRETSAHNLLLWHAMCAARVEGGTRMDLGLIDPARLPGLTHFKLGTGARAINDPPTRLLCPWDQASDGSQSTMDGKATSVAMVTASARKNGITPRNTS
ncbi:GNAT family N-acetyltransferase [Palleronia pelagia]|uniref:Acetyltransferase (GNAT) domain-containing protein n=1 Tax=Palleronia pelagia TaxID=387096 RepID=A0A1H8BK29_9RHOB|nr:GNAT family N-acetyltransferase [Palleronia pelagia]SEM83152.1 Acetyltransferase (GNAT) domain-containing protein [Palleronia pelagia]